MSKRPRNSQAPTSASEDLVELLKAAANDTELLQEFIESNDSGAVAAAFAALLTGGSASEPNAANLRKARNRPCRSALNETLVEILLFADRDTLDAMQLVGLFLRDFIRDREAAKLPLRSFSEVNIGKFCRPQLVSKKWTDHWLPFGVLKVSGTGKELFSDDLGQLVPYLRVVYCGELSVDLRWTRSDVSYGAGYGLLRSIFDDLVVSSTFLDLLTVYVDDQSAIFALQSSSFNEAFSVSAAEYGVRSLCFDSGPRSTIRIALSAALSFVFAEPTTGGHRSISGVLFELKGDDVFKQLLEKASELDKGQRIDFKFSIGSILLRTEPAGFEKYRKDQWVWVVDDLENGITVKFEYARFQRKHIHVYSSV